MAFAIKPLAWTILTAKWTRSPLDVRPDGGLLSVAPCLVALRIFAVTAPFEKGLETLHDRPGFEKTAPRVFKSKPAWSKIHKHLERSGYERVGLVQTTRARCHDLTVFCTGW